MKLILIYGPPAVGKLTIAKELQKISGYKLLHNHLLIDLIESIDDERSEDFHTAHYAILEEIFKYAIARKVNFINTFVYGKGIDDDFMKFVRTAVERVGGEVFFVQIFAEKNVLLKRVKENSRKKYGKITDPVKLDKLMSEYDLVSPYKNEDLQINNTDLTPTEVADIIWKKLSDKD